MEVDLLRLEMRRELDGMGERLARLEGVVKGFDLRFKEIEQSVQAVIDAFATSTTIISEGVHQALEREIKQYHRGLTATTKRLLQLEQKVNGPKEQEEGVKDKISPEELADSAINSWVTAYGIFDAVAKVDPKIFTSLKVGIVRAIKKYAGEVSDVTARSDGEAQAHQS